MLSSESKIDISGLSAYDVIVVGAGFAGSVIARELAERCSKRVALIESRAHVGGNAFDELDEHGILIHSHGPHIFHTNDDRVFDYLSRFTQWRPYEHEVLARISEDLFIPVPFNINSMEAVYGEEKASRLVSKLEERFGAECKIAITELMDVDDEELNELASFVYENIFLRYTQKQWGSRPEEIDRSVIGRVPVFVSRDNRYFQDKHQGIPLYGYAKLFESMLDCELIDVFTSLDARDVLGFDESDGAISRITVCGEPFDGLVVYTGAIDELFGNRFGRLPYRSLDFSFENHPQRHWQPCGTVNYTVSEDFTRITEFTYLTGQESDSTTIMREYPRAYTADEGQVPYYAIINDENNAQYGKYADLVSGLENFHLLGRLAEYRYYNMDAVVAKALGLADRICG